MKRRKFKIWSEEEIAFIKANYEVMTAAEMVKKFRVTDSQFKNMMFKNGIHKKSNNGRFKKKHKSWNKGRKGTHFSPATEWKEGHLPHNTLYDGAVKKRFYTREGRIYTFIRTAKAKWELLGRWNWIQKHGPIPKGFVVRHKDGDTLNCELENLELVSRAEHLELCHKNHNSDGFIAGLMSHHNPELREELKRTPEILELKRKELTVRRKLNEYRKPA